MYKTPKHQREREREKERERERDRERQRERQRERERDREYHPVHSITFRRVGELCRLVSSLGWLSKFILL
jgi:hypothetical protein